jgi:hypothetical protein
MKQRRRRARERIAAVVDVVVAVQAHRRGDAGVGVLETWLESGVVRRQRSQRPAYPRPSLYICSIGMLYISRGESAGELLALLDGILLNRVTGVGAPQLDSEDRRVRVDRLLAAAGA